MQFILVGNTMWGFYFFFCCSLIIIPTIPTTETSGERVCERSKHFSVLDINEKIDRHQTNVLHTVETD